MTQSTVYDIMEGKNCTDETAVQLLHKAKDQIDKVEEVHNTRTAAHEKKWKNWLKFWNDIFNMAFWFNIIYCICGMIFHADYSVIPCLIIIGIMLFATAMKIVEFFQKEAIDTQYLNDWTDNYKVYKLCWAYYRYSIQKAQLRAVLDVTRKRALNPAEIEYLEKFLTEQ